MLFNSISDLADSILDQEVGSVINNRDIKILEAIDLMAEKVAERNNSNTSKPTTKKNNTIEPTSDDDGVTLKRRKNFILMIVNPSIKNITGVALYKSDPKAEAKSFHDFDVRKLHSYEVLASISNDSLEISAHIPAESFEKIKMYRNEKLVSPDRIIFKIYYKNAMFNENVTDIGNNTILATIESESKIIGMTIPHYDERELPSGVFTIFKKIHKLNDTKSDRSSGCSDNLITNQRESRGWDRNLANYRNESDKIVVCPVKRLAFYGFVTLLGNKFVTKEEGEEETTNVHKLLLFYIMIVGCSLSILGIMMIFLTALVYDNWKKREATPLIVNVSIQSFLQLTLFFITSSGIIRDENYCLVIGGILHYIILVGFLADFRGLVCLFRSNWFLVCWSFHLLLEW